MRSWEVIIVQLNWILTSVINDAGISYLKSNYFDIF